MSCEISRSLGRRSAPDLIARLDAACYRLESRERPIPGLVKGPFGAFSIHPEPTDTSLPVLDLSTSNTVEPRPQEPPESEQVCSDAEWMCLRSDLDTSDAYEFLQFLDSTVDLEQLVDDSHGPEATFDNGLTGSVLEPLATDDLPPLDREFASCQAYDHVESEQFKDTSTSLVGGRSPSLSVIAPDLTPAGEPILPAHSEPLLRHYKQQVYEADINKNKSKSAWQLIFFPCALETFAELSIWKSTSHTRFALLYSLLSLSAFRLYNSNDSDFRGESWHGIAVQYQAMAQGHLRAALKIEMSNTGQVKYKELLMAILAISMISVSFFDTALLRLLLTGYPQLSRGSNSFQIFLLDAERFIRRQGLVDEIPFEHRLLHHMYSNLRVLSESIGARLAAPTDDPTRVYNEPPEKDGKFCLAIECYDIGLDPAEEKTPDVGYTDIHFQVQGRWKKSLYPAIFGFPESLWVLLSQTVATANEKKRLESLNPPDPALMNALNHHISNLERTIWAWTSTADLIGPQRPEHLSSPENQDVLDNPQSKSLAQALHQALFLYFYRRLFNLSPMILQDVVGRTFNYLEPCISWVHDQDLGVCIAWASLIAASEAVDPALQERALRLLSATDEQGIFLTDRPSTKVVATIWEDRKSLAGKDRSWRDYIATG